MKQSILFVTHKPKQCGVYEFGRNIFNAIQNSQRFNFIKAECDSLKDLNDALSKLNPSAIIYNYHPSVMPWLCTKISKGLYHNKIAGINAIQLGIIHEVTQAVADSATAYRNKIVTGPGEKRLNALFDFYIAPDPTLLLKNPYVFKTGRLVLSFIKTDEKKPTTIGSFGFGTPNKGFEQLVKTVQKEFDEAVIRLNMPAAFYGDADGAKARNIAEQCREILYKPGIKLEITHEFLEDEKLLNFLNGNSMNVFMYQDKSGRGISSTCDFALAVKKPVAVSRCPMFRHILMAQPSVCIEDLPLKQILMNGFAPLEEISKEWTEENIRWDYERIVDVVLEKGLDRLQPGMGIKKTFKSKLNKAFSVPEVTFTWLRNTDAANDDDPTQSNTTYSPVTLQGKSLNMILDDTARKIYKPAIEKLFKLAPSTMAKKISRANVQQGFVFDTVCRYIKDYSTPKILCVGSYEDTASMALQKLGYKVEEIDPMINYFLQEFYTKPSTRHQSYDIIFSTSVIEHDPDDKSFVQCIEGLLDVNGVAIITCDYKDGWKPGEPKPDVDARFYTKEDLEKRLLSYLPNSQLVDKGEWDCENPDFNYLGRYQYTFATFVFRKLK
ncbi:MAG: hypothetical protein WKF35_10255 [Ferruginibacter sp.]